MAFKNADRKFKMPRIYIEGSDLKQVAFVTKNELIKSVRGRKFLASVAVIGIIFLLITFLPFLSADHKFYDDVPDMLQSYLSNVASFSTLIVALIGSVSLVSEFEERTALILFTRPVKRTSIFIGKFLSSLILCTLIMLGYYVGVAIVNLCMDFSVSSHLLESFVYCFFYVFAVTGIAFLMSSIFKKGTVAIIFTLLTAIIIIPVVSVIIGGDTWFMLDTAGKSTLNCLPEYIASYNDAILQISDAFDSIIAALESQSPPDEALITAMKMIKELVMSFMLPLEIPDMIKETAVMFVWGFVPLTASWILFLRKQF